MRTRSQASSEPFFVLLLSLSIYLRVRPTALQILSALGRRLNILNHLEARDLASSSGKCLEVHGPFDISTCGVE